MRTMDRPSREVVDVVSNLAMPSVRDDENFSPFRNCHIKAIPLTWRD